MSDFIKKYWLWLVGGAAVILGLVIYVTRPTPRVEAVTPVVVSTPTPVVPPPTTLPGTVMPATEAAVVNTLLLDQQACEEDVLLANIGKMWEELPPVTIEAAKVRLGPQIEMCQQIWGRRIIQHRLVLQTAIEAEKSKIERETEIRRTAELNAALAALEERSKAAEAASETAAEQTAAALARATGQRNSGGCSCTPLTPARRRSCEQARARAGLAPCSP